MQLMGGWWGGVGRWGKGKEGGEDGEKWGREREKNQKDEPLNSVKHS